MFLLPAAGALFCDASILYLYLDFALLQPPRPFSVLTVLTCLVRLALFVPLGHHVSAGTRVVHPVPYLIFHVSSLGTAVAFYSSNHHAQPELGLVITAASVLSIVLHCVLLFHVTSSAPVKRNIVPVADLTSAHFEKKKMMAYWIYTQYQKNILQKKRQDKKKPKHFDPEDSYESGMESDYHKEMMRMQEGEEDDDDEDDDEENEKDDEENETKENILQKEEDNPLTTIVDSLSTSTQPDLEMGFRETQPFLQQHIQHMYKHGRRSKRDKDLLTKTKNGLIHNRTTAQPSAFWKSLSDKQRKIRFMTCFSDHDFFHEIKSRFQHTKHLWVNRLENFTYRIQVLHPPGGGGGTTTTTTTTHLPTLIHHLTPFRALLQLYAYEDVFENHKLDRAFSGEDLYTLSFFAPQLLCFLLHNAFLNTGKLQRWILRKCTKNLYFAHRCYWFIRSWCLQGGIDEQKIRLQQQQQQQQQEEEGIQMSQGSSTSGGGEKPSIIESRIGGSSTSLSSLLDGWGKKSDINPDGTVSAEERLLMQSLLDKIMKCGQVAAAKLEQDTSDTLLSRNAAEYVERNAAIKENGSCFPPEWIPTDPISGSLSISHSMALQSTQPTVFPSKISSLTDKHELFLQTPRFFDALIAIADDLKSIPRSERNITLQKRLGLLEAQFLPSNSIYAPMNNCMHSVWRIVASESLAISTKERVPCIVCLEVLDHDKISSSTGILEQSENPMGSGESPTFRFGSSLMQNRLDHDILRSWYTTPRYPHRHNSLLDKVSSYTQQSLKKLRDDIEGTIQQHDPRFFGVNFFHDRNTDGILSLSELDTSCVKHENGVCTELIEGVNVDEEYPSTDSRMNIKPPLPTTLSSLQTRSVFNPVQTQSKPGDEFTISLSNTPTSSLPSSRSSSRPSSPVSNLGQWTSPPKNMSKRILVGDKAPKLVTGEIDSSNIRSSFIRRDDHDDESEEHPNHRRQLSASSTNHEYGSTDCLQSETSRIPITNNNSSRTTRIPIDSSSIKDKASSSYRSNKSTPAIVFKEDWTTKQNRLRAKSAFGSHPHWRLLPILIKSNDDLRQEQLASQLIHCMGSILARAKVSVWLYPYEIIALTYRGGIIEAIPDTISMDSLKKNDPTYTDLKAFFEKHFGPSGSDEYEDAKANFIESLAAYSIVCFLLQIKDRHNGNILLDNKGHLIHIDFGFFFLSSPGKNSGFESAPFKLTREFVDLMDGPNSRTFSKFRELCCRTFLELRKNCYQITLLVEMLMEGNRDLNCFRGKPEVAVQELQERFCLDLNDRACVEFVNSLVDDSLENWRTTWYDRYQRCFVGVM